jgi:beta-barrel assembly-enhancing protease
MGLPASASPLEIAEAERLSQRALDHWLESEVRLQRISQRVRVAGRELCGDDVSPVLGLTVSGTMAVPEALQLAAEQRFGDGRMRVVRLFPGMAAERAGVKQGDIVVSVESGKVTSEMSVYRLAPSQAATVSLRIVRDGEEREIQVENDRGCAYSSQLTIQEEVNAFAASGLRGTFFTTAILRELERDEELAFVVGHELAHIIIERVADERSRGQENEAQADYIGAYLAVRAGFPLDEEDMRVFDALALGDLSAIERTSRSHPVTAARAFALRQTLAEIEEKQSAGAALMPSGKGPLAR